MSDDMGVASVVLLVSIKMLKERYTDAQIKRILSPRNVKAAIELAKAKDSD